MRRVDCHRCGAVAVEEVPWGDGKRTLSKAYMLFLARWARRLSWKETAGAFRTSWDKVFDAVEHVVTWGLEHRVLGQIDAIGVDEAHRLGMVSKIFPTEELSERTLAFARRIAELPTVSALLIKESVNQTVDNMGFYNSLQSCFTLHQLNHAHWAEVHEDRYPAAQVEDGIADWRNPPPVLLSVPDAVEGPSTKRQKA